MYRMEKERELCEACAYVADGWRFIYCVKNEKLLICCFYLFEPETRTFHDEEGYVVEVSKVKFNSEDYNSALRNSFTKMTGKNAKTERKAFLAWRMEHEV